MEIEESPFQSRHNAVWNHGAHYSDFRHYDFINEFAIPDEPQYPVILRDPSKPVGVALFGALGRAGSIHIRNVLSERRSKLFYIVEERVQEAEELLNRWNVIGVKIVNPKEAHLVFKDSSVDMVIVASPTQYHEDTVTAALNHGKAVFCEKPIADSTDKTQRCYQLAKEKGLPLMSAFNRRFDKGFGNIQRRKQEGEIGKVHFIKTCSRDSPLPTLEYLKISGGIFHDCAVHDIDLVCWVLGAFPSQVFVSAHAHIPEIRQIGDYDTVAIVLTFDSGAIATIDLSRNSVYGYDQRLEVFGSKGMLLCQNEKPNEVSLFQPGGINMNPMFYSFPSRYADAYKAELQHFLNVMYGQEKMIVTEEQTIAVTRIATACEDSVKKNIPIQLCWDSAS